MEAILWGIVASLFLTSCGSESLLSVKLSATSIKMFSFIDLDLAWAGVLKCMDTLSLLGLSSSWIHAEDPRILGIMMQMLHCFVVDKNQHPL